MKRSLENGRIGIDGRSKSSHAKWGGATYVHNLLLNIPFLDALLETSPSNNFLWNNLRVPKEARRRGWLAYHAPNYTAPLRLDVPLILSVHDLAYLDRKEWYPYRNGPLRKAFYKASIRKASRIIVPSFFTRREMISRFPQVKDRVRVIPLAASRSFYPDLEEAARISLEYDLPDRYLLHVGDLHPRRRMDLMSEAARKPGCPWYLSEESWCLFRRRIMRSAWKGFPLNLFAGFTQALKLCFISPSMRGSGFQFWKQWLAALPWWPVRAPAFRRFAVMPPYWFRAGPMSLQWALWKHWKIGKSIPGWAWRERNNSAGKRQLK